MPEWCDAKIRPFPNDLELQCERLVPHEDPATQHMAVLRNYSFPGSETEIVWYEDDRRTFRGEWKSCTTTKGCILPNDHHGRCAL